MFCHRPASGCRAWRWTFRHKRSSTPGCRCLLIILYIVHKSFHSSSSSSSWSSLGFPSPFTLPPGVWLDRRQDWTGRRGGERGGGGGPQPHSEWGGGGEWGGTRRRRRRPWTRFATCAKVHISNILTVSNFLRTDSIVHNICTIWSGIFSQLQWILFLKTSGITKKWKIARPSALAQDHPVLTAISPCCTLLPGIPNICHLWYSAKLFRAVRRAQKCA